MPVWPTRVWLYLRCLDVGLQHADLRATWIKTELIQAVLPLLTQGIVGQQGPFAALRSALDMLSHNSPETDMQDKAASASMCPALLQIFCRTALHLQLTAASSPDPHAATSPASAAAPGHDGAGEHSSHDGHVIADRTSFGQQQAALVEHEEARQAENGVQEAGTATTAEVAILEGCQVVQELLEQLQVLGPAVATCMVSCRHACHSR